MAVHADDRVVDNATFRQVMANVVTPVTVVTACDGAVPHGTTVSAFTSLSMTPPMVLVSLDLGSDLLEMVRRTGRFGVNVLGADSAAHALAFARKGRDKFDGRPWAMRDRVPQLAGAAAWLSCAVQDLLEGGDHLIVTGLVREAENFPVAPLTYHDRRFGTHSAFREERS
jgi:flavin reductase (DIM6/NTAB) family NADH-FMN oxidoreductase RutF